MNSPRIRRAIISVSDKQGIVELAQVLVQMGTQIISTGGTARLLVDAGVAVTPIEQVTGLPEMMDGRVKTLHPQIHGGVLMDRNKVEHVAAAERKGIKPIDMVVVNLYPFEQTVARPDCSDVDAIENIDIGGPCLLRAAAKNHEHVWAVPWPAMAKELLAALCGEGDAQRDLQLRRRLAGHVFDLTGRYDNHIAEYLAAQSAGRDKPHLQHVTLRSQADLRYGENPHQSATLYRSDPSGVQDEAHLLDANQVSGPEMSFNNYIDGEAALELVKDLHGVGTPAVAVIKHTNPCGAAIAESPIDAYRKAYLGDASAAAGGVLATSFAVTEEIAEQILTSYRRWGKAAGAAFFKLDVWIAPAFDDDALKLIVTPTENRKWGAQCRLLAVGEMAAATASEGHVYRHLLGGFLRQQRDLNAPENDKVVTEARPSAAQLEELRFAMTVCKHSKSNAITITRDRQLLGNGVGQMSRVTSARLALELAQANGHNVHDAVAASDAFFPVPDGPSSLYRAGIAAIIQPGGSNRDPDVVDAANAAGRAMVMTGVRHFRH